MSGNAGSPTRTLFRRCQTSKIIIAKRSNEDFSSKARSRISKKLKQVPVFVNSLLKCTYHISFRFGQDQRACNVSSGCTLQSEHTASVKICLRTKLTRVGRELVPTRHTRDLTWFGTCRFHIAFQTFEFTPPLDVSSYSGSSCSIRRR